MASLPNLRRLPFYRERLDARGEPTPWTLDDLETFGAEHPDDPYAGRVPGKSKCQVSLQLEATGDPPIWAGLNGPELDRWAGVLARMWSRWGTAPGETIAFFEYGSSPLVLLASSGYVGYLRRGAADRLALSAICNDGVATMAARMVSIVESVRPSMLILRRELAQPLAAALDASGVSLGGRVRWIALSEVDGAPPAAEAERYASILQIPVYRVFRSDAAYLLAGECAQCKMFHLDREYRARPLGDDIAITARFARTCPAINANIGSARLIEAGCATEPRAQRIEA
jgi:phenylacetate-coenzyme A ligase PaaK-like adenylate-forming protein